MENNIFGGLGVALVTPFKEDNSIDLDSLERIIHHVIDGGCDYIVALGTTAETPTLSPSEKSQLASFIKKIVNSRVPLVMGIGGNDTIKVVKDIQTMDLNGYSAVLSVVPYYNKPTQEGLYQHFKYISQNSPLPILLYNVPGRTGVNLSAETTLRLASDPKFCGIKEASGNFKQIEEILNSKPAYFQVISGNDADTARLMKLGGAGVISVLANALPIEMKKLVNLAREKRFREAEVYQESLKPLISHLFEDGNPAGVKSLLADLGLLKNKLRLPLVPVSENVAKKLQQCLQNINS